MSPGRIVRASLIGACVLAAAVVGAASLGAGALCLVPAFLLFAALLARLYPGARQVARLAARRRAPRIRAAILFAAPRPVRTRPRGGLLLASGLAERGPPAGFAAS